MLRLLAARARLVTLTGTGGVGKTRLAQEIAWRLLETDSAADGVWWVELASLSDPRRVSQTVASTLGLQEESERQFVEVLLAAVRGRRLVLVLDNCEHLIDACAELVHDLLRACPNLTLLATSREPLKTSGEIERHLAPLACPDPTRLPTLDRLRDFDAVRLFAERATGASRRFQLTEYTAPSVARVCQQLDGIPLVLELAAARVRVLSSTRSRLASTTVLACWPMAVAPPHAGSAPSKPPSPGATTCSPRASSDCSTGWPSSGATGPWKLPKPSAATPISPWCWIRRGTWSRNPWLSSTTGRTAPAYRMPETIRQFAAARLLAAGQASLLRERHFRWYVELGLEAEQALRFVPLPWPARERWMTRLQLESANLRAAWQWALDGEGSPRLGLELVAGLFPMFWTGTGFLAEGIDCYAAMLERDFGSGPGSERSWALATGAKLAAEYGTNDLAARWANEYFEQPSEPRKCT